YPLVTGVQTCALPICRNRVRRGVSRRHPGPRIGTRGDPPMTILRPTFLRLRAMSLRILPGHAWGKVRALGPTAQGLGLVLAVLRSEERRVGNDGRSRG